MAAEQALDAGARRRQLHAQIDRVGRREREALEQIGVALGEPALCGERAGAGEQELEALDGVALIRQQAQRGAEPASGARGGAQDRPGARLRQHGHRGQVPGTRGELHVMGARQRPRAAVGQDRRAALVGAEQPAAGDALVDRAADERVAEAKAPRNVGAADEAELEQLVERRHRVVDPGGRGGEVDLERVARDGGAAEHLTGVVGQRAQLLGERGDHRGWDAHGLQRGPRERRAGALGAGELLEVERVAAGLLVELVGALASHAIAEQLARGLSRESLELEAAQAALAVGAFEGRGEPPGPLPRAGGEHQQDGGVGRAAQERGE